MRAWLVVGLAAGMAVASPVPGGAASAEDSWCPPHPTVVMTTVEGQRLPVIGVNRDKPQVAFKGGRRSVATDAGFFFERTAAFAPGRIDISNPEMTETTLVRTGLVDYGGSRRVDLGMDYRATLRPTRPYQDCYLVLVFVNPDFMAGSTDEPGTGFLFHRIGDLDPDKPTKIHFAMGREVPRDQRKKRWSFVLLFSGGVEIRTNQAEGPASFFRRLELIAHRRILAADRERNARGNRAAQACLAMPPVWPDGTDLTALPPEIHAVLVVGGDGTVRSVDLREALPEPVARVARQTLGAWLFLPALEDGRPAQAKVEAVVKAAGPGPAP